MQLYDITVAKGQTWRCKRPKNMLTMLKVVVAGQMKT